MADIQPFQTANGVSGPERGLDNSIIQQLLKPSVRGFDATRAFKSLAFGVENILTSIRKSPFISKNPRIQGLSFLLPQFIDTLRDGFPSLNALNRSIAKTAIEILLDPNNTKRYARTAPLVSFLGFPNPKGFIELGRGGENATSKCNLFVFDVMIQNGMAPALNRIGPDRNPGATELADSAIQFKNLSEVFPGINNGEPGDVLAFLGTNHTGIYVGNGLYIGATTDGVNFRGETDLDFVCIATVESDSGPAIRKVVP
jgi:hypothetical protein